MKHVLWPSDVPYRASSHVYGWPDAPVVVAGTYVGEEAILKEKLEAFGSDQSLRSSGTVQPCVLGRVTEKGLWLELAGVDEECLPIQYRRPAPNSMRFYSISGLELDLSPHANARSAARTTHPIIQATKPLSGGGMSDRTIAQMNAAISLCEFVESHTCALAVGTCVTGALEAPLTRTLWAWVIVAMSTLLCVTNLRVRIFSSMALKDISATVQQIDVRAEQALFFPRQIRYIRRGSQPLHLHVSRYINFFNTVWLILNDIILGIALGGFLRDNADLLTSLLVRDIKPMCTDDIQRALVWLDNWPAGLKLNTELSAAYAHALLGLVDLWGHVLAALRPHLPILIRLFGYAGAGGLTLLLALASDALSLLTAHLYLAALACTAVFARMLRAAGSLWNLFRGKRYNVLRNRVDSWEYDLDQLLFGTILFTLLAFLFPTVLVYYTLFALTRLAVILLHAGVETVLAFLNHFPLFALMLRIKDPWRLPGGVAFIINREDEGKPELTIVNQPIAFSAIFFQYLHLWTRLSAHYSPLRLVRCLVRGEFVTPIARWSIRYARAAHTDEQPDSAEK